MALKHLYSVVTYSAANFDHNGFRIISEIVFKLFVRRHSSGCAVQLESELTPFGKVVD